jgi:preprotein translocase subunit SecY
MAYRTFKLIVGLAAALAAAYFLVEGGRGLCSALTATPYSADALTKPMTHIITAIVVIAVFYFVFVAKTSIKRVLENIFSVPDLLKKIAFTLALLCIYRVGFHIPLPGLDQGSLTRFMAGQAEGPLGQAMEYFAMFTGGNLQKCTLFGLGIMPYISASIIFQLLVTVVPALEKLQKEGQAGQKKIQEYTRYATVGLCIVQAVGIWSYIMRPNLYPRYADSTSVFLMAILGLTAGTVFLMWLGEQIDEYGIGNGISLIIMAGIVARMPWAIRELVSRTSLKVTDAGSDIGLISIVFLIGAFVFVVAGSILITQAQRRIPIQQAKHTRGRRVYGGQRQYLPLRVNHGGVMPIIFASSLMMFPNAMARWFAQRWPDNSVAVFFGQAFNMGNLVYQLVYVGMIFFFAYFWTTVQFRPKDMSDQLRDYGSFIPGLRPGKRTADYLERVMERITYCGAAFLATIAVIPQAVSAGMGIPPNIAAYLGGTGLLIMVSVALDMVQRIEAELIMRNYGGFLSGGGRIKGARG